MFPSKFKITVKETKLDLTFLKIDIIPLNQCGSNRSAQMPQHLDLLKII